EGPFGKRVLDLFDHAADLVSGDLAGGQIDLGAHRLLDAVVLLRGGGEGVLEGSNPLLFADFLLPRGVANLLADAPGAALCLTHGPLVLSSPLDFHFEASLVDISQ